MMKVVIFLIFLSNYANSFVIESADVKCVGEGLCLFFEKSAQLLKRKYTSRDEFEVFFEAYYSKPEISSLSYHFKSGNEGAYKLWIHAQEKSIVKRVVIEGVSAKIRKGVLESIRRDDLEYETPSTLVKYKQRVIKYLSNQGYNQPKVGVRFINLRLNEVGLFMDIALGERSKLIQEIKYNCGEGKVLSIGKNFFSTLESKPFIDSEVEKSRLGLEELLRSFGYYFSRVKVINQKQDTYLVDCGDLTQTILQVESKNHSLLSKELMHESFKTYLLAEEEGFSFEDFSIWLENYMLDKGLDRNSYEVSFKKKVDEEGAGINLVTVKLISTKRNELTRLVFIGNIFFSDEELRKMFYDSGGSFIQSKLFKEKALESFTDILLNEYVLKGFFDAQVTHYYEKKGNKFLVRFRIVEGTQSLVGDINVKDENGDDFSKEFSKISGLKEDSILNPRVIEVGIKKFFDDLKSKGFADSYMRSLDSEVISLPPKGQKASIGFNFFKGEKKVVVEISYLGLVKTKRKVLERKLRYVKNSVLSPKLLRRISNDISSLNLFKSIQLKNLNNEPQAHLQLIVEEKDFGLLEVSPGFRTDLGAKVSARFLRKNLMGKNASGDFFAQINYRADLGSLNAYREENTSRFAEYNLKSSLNYPDFFYSSWDMFGVASVLRKRLFFVDADIMRFNISFRRNLLDNLGFSLGYQFENIRQFNAAPRANGDDNGRFQIGGLVPSLIYDLRDDPVLPRKGAQFQVTMERAMPSLGSQRESPLRIDYTKLTSRNKFYLSMGESFYIASSLTMGFQYNYASKLKTTGSITETEGFIPSIKVYRLSGIDLVRGYAEDEINLVNNQDISEIAIRDKAFMTNLKFEPRYRLNKSMILGLFFDAGSVQVGKLKLLQMRSSVGLSLKYVTPVGTLDLDYGLKVKRRTGESAGRFHLSIGFF